MQILAEEWAQSARSRSRSHKRLSFGYGVFGSYISDRCVIGHSFTVQAGQIYLDHKDWCDKTGEQEMIQKALGIKLGERGFKQGKDAKGRRLWRGVGMKSELSPDCEGVKRVQ